MSHERCELLEDTRCPNAATVTMREPYTPSGVRVRCCESCATGLAQLGYTRSTSSSDWPSREARMIEEGITESDIAETRFPTSFQDSER